MDIIAFLAPLVGLFAALIAIYNWFRSIDIRTLKGHGIEFKSEHFFRRIEMGDAENVRLSSSAACGPTKSSSRTTGSRTTG